ncbi:MAG: L-seryl-tRNA(Sec) selenium transferase [Spirochaetaceae bacterium]|jgi:L-seryl-tRNA(Ser) seleniumtransferase|nr:L-seryl-tRNA(Sec) selenium transferase [Spirochaetaceae bacterium]
MANTNTNNILRSIPAMDELLNAPWAAGFYDRLGRETVKSIIAETLDDLKRDICGGAQLTQPAAELAANRAEHLLHTRAASSLKPVVNATGVVIHTNLGRAPLADEARQAADAVSGAYSTLEYSPAIGGRDERNTHVEWLVRQTTGAEAALIVNNNAAAVLLALSATAAGHEVIVSCGELVEIGGSFRIPEILSFSGAIMKPVGCTNSTRISDYRNAITENTTVLLKVHPSNYHMEGFVKTASREELAELAADHNLIFMEDLGSGLLHQPALPFANREPAVRDCLKAGSGIVTFSGDKLLGGPQIGVIAGSKNLVDMMKRHQLLRALRVDKMTLAAFEATLRLYISGRQAEIPVIRMLESDKSALLKKARVLRRALRDVLKTADALNAGNFTVSVIETRDAAGGGSFPADTFPGFGVEIRAAAGAATMSAGFRTARVPVIAGIQDDGLVLHVRTLLPGDEKLIAAAFAEVLNKPRGC